MKRLLGVLFALSMLASIAGCKAEIKPVDAGGGPGFAVVLSEEDQKKVDEGISKFENVVDKLTEVLPVIANIAKLAGEASDDEDFSDGADAVATAAEKGAAGLGVLMALGMLLKNIVKKEDS